jgi:hypothetical protein
MELPYQPISESEAEELCQDLADVALSFGDRDLCASIKRSYSKDTKAGGSMAAARLDIQGLPDR